MPHFTITFVILGVLWSTMVTFVCIVAVGYDVYTIESEFFNASSSLWYERMFPGTSWIPPSRTCEGSIIKRGEGNRASDKGVNKRTHNSRELLLFVRGIL